MYRPILHGDPVGIENSGLCDVSAISALPGM